MSTEKEKKAALEKIEKLKKEALALISEAEKIADKVGVVFFWDLAYGMGGAYHPRKNKDDKSTVEDTSDGEWSDSTEGWVSSSEGC